ncbi:MAG: 6,7-dimethyl-8-ribityllumazine synthase [Saprospiraceae bacterium]|jgi:6,7-dimethyl-8-ribityllumazine synthase|nr:6,7-dimethyl-8-ribityllumazine synthase [Saprospiraceae bacterium]MBP7642374.1 6,7-dimethyl-8-ribityllumazine synthase [Saprospiraceae bacterium]HMS70145.1 6,7-dimethyl-8-ribityllumazine synthase [Saprospiraceae bacterium]
MSSVMQNLSSTFEENKYDASELKVGIVVAKWNEKITSVLKQGALDTLLKNGLKEENTTILDVPGAFELPMGARLLLESKKYDGIICLGCVIKGETKHDEYISNAVANGIMQLGLTSGKPIIFGVLTPNDEQQAIDRSSGVHGNKGIEAAMTLLQMLQLAKNLKQPKKGIGY